MDEPFGLEVLHAVADLDGEAAQREDGEAGAQVRLLQTLEQRAERGQLRHLGRSGHRGVISGHWADTGVNVRPKAIMRYKTAI